MKSLRLLPVCLFLILLPVFIPTSAHAASPAPPRSGEAGKLAPLRGQKIWDLSRITDRKILRVELTDLVRFKGHWYCGFHEGEIHGNHPAGRARIIRSPDGAQWESVALLAWDAGDVREPRFSITAEGHLMVNTSVCFVSKQPRADGNYYQLTRGTSGATEPPLANPDGDLEASVSRQSVTWISADGLNWSQAYACPSGVNTWRWDVTWHNGMGYSIGYSGKDMAGTLYRTRDGKSWRPLLPRFFPDGQGNEGTLAFDTDNTAYCVLRGTSDSRMIGVGQAPYYQAWTWSDTRVDWDGNGILRPAKDVIRSLGGPKILRLSDGRFLLVGRASGISLFWVDPKHAILTRFASVAGTSYAGIVEHEGAIWVSYGEGAAAAIYLARVPLPASTGKGR